MTPPAERTERSDGGQRKTRIQLPTALKALCGRADFSPGSWKVFVIKVRRWRTALRLIFRSGRVKKICMFHLCWRSEMTSWHWIHTCNPFKSKPAVVTFELVCLREIDYKKKKKKEERERVGQREIKRLSWKKTHCTLPSF